MDNYNYRVGIIGGGAVGLTYAAFISQSTKVIVKTHSQAQAAAIKAQGISLSLDDTTEIIKEVDASEDAGSLADCDVIIVTVKSYDTEQVAKEISSSLKSDAEVLSLQNGLQAFDSLVANITNPARVFRGVTYIGSSRTDDRSIKLGKNRKTIIDSNALMCVDVLGKSRFGVETSADVKQAVWDKMVLNVGQNALSAVTDLNLGQMLMSKDCLDIASKLLDEFKAVARAEEITFGYDLMEKLRDNWQASTFHPSMWQDLHKGKRTEIDAINGAISNLGRKYNVQTPYNDMITALVKSMEKH